MTTVCACEKTVVMVKQPGHLTSMKKERGAGTRVCGWLALGGRGSGGKFARKLRREMGTAIFMYAGLGECVKMIKAWSQNWKKGGHTLSLCFRASAAGVGFRRSTARTYPPRPTDEQVLSIQLFHQSSGGFCVMAERRGQSSKRTILMTNEI